VEAVGLTTRYIGNDTSLRTIAEELGALLG
jgi:hypothetical protein